MRLIDADELKRKILFERDKIPSSIPGASYEFGIEKPNHHGNSMRGGIRKALRCMEQCKTIDAVEVVHGYWDDSGRYRFASGKKAIRCNICGCALSESEYRLFNWNYCPVCGAKMDGERKTNG